ncbi:MAG: hypothetical protein ACOY30_00045 [Bacillota bacterium]
MYIPGFCSHPDLPPGGVCGICAVEVEGRQELFQACPDVQGRAGRGRPASPFKAVYAPPLEALEKPVPVMVMDGGTSYGQNDRLIEVIPGRCPTMGPDNWRAGRLVKKEASTEEYLKKALVPGPGEETAPIQQIVSCCTGIHFLLATAIRPCHTAGSS